MPRKRRAISALDKDKILKVLKKISSEDKIISKDKVENHTQIIKELENVVKNIYIPLTKMNDEEQTVTGVVLQPEVVDAQGDIYDDTVIRKAAHNFLSSFNKSTKLGLQHNDFTKKFELLESYTAPQELFINNKLVKSGSWIIVVKVKEKKIWELVKSGKITGFSIGGKAKVKKLQ